MTKFQTILYELNNSIATITMNRPDKLNAVTEQMTIDICDALDQAEKDTNVKVVILTGAGNNFSAGADLKESMDFSNPIGDEPSEVYRDQLQSYLQVSLKIWDLKKPVIAAIDGYAYGVAADWVFSVDLVIASDKAVIGEPEIRFGSAPATLMMPWVIGIRKTKELLYTGDTIDSEEGYRLGMYNKVVPQNDLMKETLKLAEKLVNIPSSPLKITKMTINKTFEMMNLKPSLDYNVETAISMFFLNQEKEIAEDVRVIKEEGLGAFLKDSE